MNATANLLGIAQNRMPHTVHTPNRFSSVLHFWQMTINAEASAAALMLDYFIVCTVCVIASAGDLSFKVNGFDFCDTLFNNLHIV